MPSSQFRNTSVELAPMSSSRTVGPIRRQSREGRDHVHRPRHLEHLRVGVDARGEIGKVRTNAE